MCLGSIPKPKVFLIVSIEDKLSNLSREQTAFWKHGWEKCSGVLGVYCKDFELILCFWVFFFKCASPTLRYVIPPTFGHFWNLRYKILVNCLFLLIASLQTVLNFQLLRTLHLFIFNHLLSALQSVLIFFIDYGDGHCRSRVLSWADFLHVEIWDASILGVFHLKVYMTTLPMRRAERCTLVLTYFSLEVVNIISIHSTFARTRSMASSKSAWNSMCGGWGEGNHSWPFSERSCHCHS